MPTGKRLPALAFHLLDSLFDIAERPPPPQFALPRPFPMDASDSTLDPTYERIVARSGSGHSTFQFESDRIFPPIFHSAASFAVVGMVGVSHWRQTQSTQNKQVMPLA
jgi:hypothetical protein